MPLGLLDLLVLLLLPLLMIWTLKGSHDSRLWRARLLHMNNNLLRLGSVALAILLVVIASAMMIRGFRDWLGETHSIPLLNSVFLVAILLCLAGINAFAVYRLIRFALNPKL